MAAFESTAKVALEEMVKSHLIQSKFGYVMTENNLQSLVTDLLDFLITSRSLKAGGDRLLSSGALPQAAKTQRVPPQARKTL